MRCPFLKEAEVKFCRSSAFRKVIVQTPGASAGEKCSSAAYGTCDVYRDSQPQEPAAQDRCPLLQHSLMQYCGAAPVTRFIPYSEELLCRCGTDSHRYCDLYSGMAHPESVPETDAIPVPPGLYYSANHMWLDLSRDGECHIGVDAFLTRLLGAIDRVTFVTTHGVDRPSAVLTVGGVDLQMVFPKPILITGANVYLRPDAGRIAADPYSLGWLFEGREAPSEPAPAQDLIQGDTARQWMDQEIQRASEFVHQEILYPAEVAADGGMPAPGLCRHLDRETMLHLFHEFFSPFASWKKSL